MRQVRPFKIGPSMSCLVICARSLFHAFSRAGEGERRRKCGIRKDLGLSTRDRWFNLARLCYHFVLEMLTSEFAQFACQPLQYEGGKWCKGEIQASARAPPAWLSMIGDFLENNL